MKTFLILPHQLFDKKYLSEDFTYLIWEHPHYFTKYNYNKKKLILHRASMKYYEEYLKSNNFKVNYCEYNKKPSYKDAYIFDPIDKIEIKGVLEMLETPNFLMTKENYAEYKSKKKEVYMFHWFYTWGKTIVDIIPNIKSQDKDNRKKLPKNIKIPDIPSNNPDKKYIDEAIKYVEKNFKNNYGNTENFLFPVTHSTVNKWFDDFVKKRFKDFGPYEDQLIKTMIFYFILIWRHQ